MSNPFDDPAVKSAFRAANVVHKPGIAADLRRELVPLLAEDGVDLDDPSGMDPETLNASIARAVERRNLALSTPVGEQEYALTLLRIMSEAIDEDQTDFARAIIVSIEPEPVDEKKAAVTHVIGVSRGLLDSWRVQAGAVCGSLKGIRKRELPRPTCSLSRRRIARSTR